MLDILLNAAIVGLSAAIGGYVMMKLTMHNLKRDAEAWLNSETGQKAIYTVGVLLGNAIKQGVGLGTGGGKMKLENIAAQAIFGFLQQKGILPSPQQNVYEQPQQ